MPYTLPPPVPSLNRPKQFNDEATAIWLWLTQKFVPELTLSGASPGSFESFGGAGDGVADDSDAVQAGIDWAIANRRPLLARGTYKVTRSIVGVGQVMADFRGAKFISTANQPIFDFRPRTYGPFALSASYAGGGDIALASALPAAPKLGAVMKITSNAVDPKNLDRGSDATQYRVGEYFTTGPGSTTTNIVLRAPLRHTIGIHPTSVAGDEARVAAYSTTFSPRVIYADPDDRMEIVGGTFAYEDGHEAAWSAAAIKLTGYIGARVTACRVIKGYGPGFDLVGTYGAIVEDCEASNLTNNTSNGQLGYGVADAGTNTKVRGLSGAETRHTYTTNGVRLAANESDPAKLIWGGRSENGVVEGMHGTGGFDPQVSTHHDGDGTIFRDPHCVGGAATAVGIRGRDVQVMSPVIRRHGKGIDIFTEYHSGDPNDDFFTAGATLDDFTSCVVSDIDMECIEEPVTVSHASLRLAGSGRIRTNDPTVFRNIGGLLTIDGNYDVVLGPGGGVANDPIFLLDAPSTKISAAIPKATTVVNGKLTIDARAVTAPTIKLIGGTGGRLSIRGNMTVRLPAGATWNPDGLEMDCSGSEGLVTYSREGGADHEIFADPSGLSGMNVQSLDGLLLWDDRNNLTVGLPKPVWRNENVNITHNGTGAEVNNVFVPKGQYAAAALNSRGYGSIRFRMTGRRDGFAGDTTIHFRTNASSLVETFTIPAAAGSVNWMLDVTCAFQSVNTQLFTSSFVYGNSAVMSLEGEISRMPDTRLFATALTPAARFGVNAASGDTVIFDTCEVIASAGGYAIGGAF